MTFSSPSWRSLNRLNPLKGRLTIQKRSPAELPGGIPNISGLVHLCVSHPHTSDLTQVSYEQRNPLGFLGPKWRQQGKCLWRSDQTAALIKRKGQSSNHPIWAPEILSPQSHGGGWWTNDFPTRLSIGWFLKFKIWVLDVKLPGCKPKWPFTMWLDLFRSARVPACKKYQPVNWGEKRGITLDANSSGQIMMFHQPIEFLEISGFRFPCCLLRWCQTWGRYLVDQIYCSGWRLSRTSWILYPILAISPWPQLLLSIPKKTTSPN